jgi:hypothetical protein
MQTADILDQKTFNYEGRYHGGTDKFTLIEQRQDDTDKKITEIESTVSSNTARLKTIEDLLTSILKVSKIIMKFVGTICFLFVVKGIDVIVAKLL